MSHHAHTPPHGPREHENVGAVLLLLHGRMLERRPGSLTDLLNPLIGVIGGRRQLVQSGATYTGGRNHRKAVA